jgi:hypothetical protein
MAMEPYSGDGDSVSHGGSEYRGPPIDSESRLLDPRKLWEAKQDNIPEDLEIFVSKWSEQIMSSKIEWKKTSKIVWPTLDYQVCPKRLDIYEFKTPYLQQATISQKESDKIRNTPGWTPVRSILLVDKPGDYTKEMIIEAAAPPRRTRVRPGDKTNHRDLTDWTVREKFHGFVTATNIPGAAELFIDWADSPDRYQINSEEEAPMGWRRLFRFGAYPLTQYYILEKIVHHDVLEAEGGRGLTCDIECGPVLFAKKGWRLKGSFYAFDHPISGTNKYTVYTIDEPFKRVMVAIGAISHVEDWKVKFVFYAFDVPAPETLIYNVQHCVRSIYSAAASVSRHRLTIEDAANPFEFRMAIYAYPAPLSSCSLTDEPLFHEEFFD